MLTGKSTFLTFIALFGATFCGSDLQGEVFNGPTSLKDKSFDTLTINGPAELRGIKAKTLNVYGPLNFNDLEVSGKTTIVGNTIGRHAELQDISVTGPFNAKDIEINSLDVSGPVNLREFTINGNSSIRGPLFAHDGYFQELVAGTTEGGEVVELSEVTVKKNIVISKGAKPEILTFTGQSDVAGDITFESGVGQVIKEGDEVEIAGKIVGTKSL